MEIKKQKYIMGTEIEIIINSNLKESEILEDIEKSFNIFYDLEKTFSRFNKESLLSKVNKYKKYKINIDFIKIIKLSKKIYKKTNKYFNPLVSLSSIGYSNDFKSNKFNKKISDFDYDFNKVIIIGDIINLEKNQNLDFGGIVKGYTVDKVKNFLIKKYSDFIINAGGDLYVNKGSYIAIDSIKNNGDIFAIIKLYKKCLSTSGIYKRKWQIKEEIYNHILNPKTNKNNNDIQSISLITENSYLGDAYATACISMGLKKSLVFLKENNIEGVIISKDLGVYQIGNLEKYRFELI